MSIIVAVCGWKGSGKDTMADRLIKEHGYQRFSFADSLKEMVAGDYNLPLNCFHDQDLKEVPLIQFPVENTDGFTTLIHEFMVGEFRTKDGSTPTYLERTDGGTKGRIGDESGKFKAYETVYWTPRALCILEGSIKRSVTSDFWVQKVISQIETKLKGSPSSKFVIPDMRYQSEVGQLSYAFNNNLITCKIIRHSKNPSVDPSEVDLDDYSMDYNIDNTDTLFDFINEVDDLVAIVEGSKM